MQVQKRNSHFCSHLSCILPRFLHVFFDIMFVQLVPGLICIFLHASPFPFLFFAELHVSSVFFGMQPLVICASPRLSFFAFLFALFLHFFQDVDILEQAQFDSTNMYRFKTLMSSLCYSLSPILENGE